MPQVAVLAAQPTISCASPTEHARARRHQSIVAIMNRWRVSARPRLHRPIELECRATLQWMPGASPGASSRRPKRLSCGSVAIRILWCPPFIG